MLRVQSTQSTDTKEAIDEQYEAESIKKAERYYVLDSGDNKGALPGYEHSPDDRSGLKVMARIPTCAIFHKLTTGRGVPHTFISEFHFP